MGHEGAPLKTDDIAVALPDIDSKILEEVRHEFLTRLAGDPAIFPHMLDAITTHFQTKTVISAAEIRLLLAGPSKV